MKKPQHIASTGKGTTATIRAAIASKAPGRSSPRKIFSLKDSARLGPPSTSLSRGSLTMG